MQTSGTALSNGDPRAASSDPTKPNPTEPKAIRRLDPKDNSRPAETRREKLNRRAREYATSAVALFVRSRPELFVKLDPLFTRNKWYRERKEGYNRAAEHTIAHIREGFGDVVEERDAAIDENQKLKELLKERGVSYLQHDQSNEVVAAEPGNAGAEFPSPAREVSESAAPIAPGGTGSISKDYSYNPKYFASQDDYDKIGVTLVLSLEAACADHLRDVAAGPILSGHALMISLPALSRRPGESSSPPSTAGAEPAAIPAPQGYKRDSCGVASASGQAPGARLPNSELIKMLLKSATRFPSEGELPPAMVLRIIREHPRSKELAREDWARIQEGLAPKAKCYGFGAFVEESQLRDALDVVFKTKGTSASG